MRRQGAQRVDVGAGCLTGDHRHRGDGREPELGPTGALRRDQPVGVGVHRGADDLVVGQPGLQEETPAPGATTDQARRAREQRHGLFGRPVARRQQLLVEVEEHDHVGAAHAVQHRFGAHEDGSSLLAGAVGSYLRDGPAHERLELLRGARHTHAKRLEPGASARGANRRTRRAAPRAAQALTVLLHGRSTSLATHELAACDAREEAGAAFAVQDAHHALHMTCDRDQAL